MVGYAVCEGSLGASVSRSANGHYLGTVEDAGPLLEAVGRLRAAGAEAIAIVTSCGGTDAEDWEEHYLNAGVNPVGALEALLSRLVTRVTGLPSAHAPLYVGALGHYDGVVDPRVAGEVASGTGLPCVLLGLSRAPATVADGGVAVTDLTGIIVPYGCAVGIPAHGAQAYDVPLLAVRPTPAWSASPSLRWTVAGWSRLPRPRRRWPISQPAGPGSRGSYCALPPPASRRFNRCRR